MLSVLKKDTQLSKSDGNGFKTKGEIPQTIHQIWWQSIYVPNQFKSICASWSTLNPSWYYRLWDSRQLLDFLKKEYPSFLCIYNKLKGIPSKVHFFAYLLMWHYGGVFAEIDMECLSKKNQFQEDHLNEILEDREVVLSVHPNNQNWRKDLFERTSAMQKSSHLNGLSLKEAEQVIPERPLFNTTIMASKPRHIFWMKCLYEMGLQVSNPVGGPWFETRTAKISRETGDLLISKVFLNYRFSSTKFLFLPPYSTDPNPSLFFQPKKTDEDPNIPNGVFLNHHFHMINSYGNWIAAVVVILIFVVVAVYLFYLNRNFKLRKTLSQPDSIKWVDQME